MHFYKCRVRHAAKLKWSGRCSESKCVRKYACKICTNCYKLFNYAIIANARLRHHWATSLPHHFTFFCLFNLFLSPDASCSSQCSFCRRSERAFDRSARFRRACSARSRLSGDDLLVLLRLPWTTGATGTRARALLSLRELRLLSWCPSTACAPPTLPPARF